MIQLQFWVTVVMSSVHTQDTLSKCHKVQEHSSHGSNVLIRSYESLDLSLVFKVSPVLIENSNCIGDYDNK